MLKNCLKNLARLRRVIIITKILDLLLEPSQHHMGDSALAHTLSLLQVNNKLNHTGRNRTEKRHLKQFCHGMFTLHLRNPLFVFPTTNTPEASIGIRVKPSFLSSLSLDSWIQQQL